MAVQTQILGKVAIVSKGEYNPLTTYNKLDIVTYQGSSYLCDVNDTTGILPTNIEYWKILAQKGADGVIPRKGIDYYTLEEKTEMENSIVEDITQILNTKADKNEIPDVSNFITASVNNLVNYYLKSETYNKAEVDNLISAIKTGIFQVVATLPTATADTMNIIYLIPSTDPKTQNVKDEYITIRADNNYQWEKIGSTAINLTGYATENWVNMQIADFLTSTEIQELINTAVSNKYTKPNTGIPKTDLANTVQASLDKADTALQEHQDISGKENISNKVISAIGISSNSTDTQYPSAKSVYDYFEANKTIITMREW